MEGSYWYAPSTFEVPCRRMLWQLCEAPDSMLCESWTTGEALLHCLLVANTWLISKHLKWAKAVQLLLVRETVSYSSSHSFLQEYFKANQLSVKNIFSAAVLCVFKDWKMTRVLCLSFRLPWLVLWGGVQWVSVCSLPELRHMQGSHQRLRVCLHATVWRYVWTSRTPPCYYVKVTNVQNNESWQDTSECVCAGRHCEIHKDPCLKVRCQNGGRCESVGLNASCACPPGYQGEHWRLWSASLAIQWKLRTWPKMEQRHKTAKGEAHVEHKKTCNYSIIITH